MALTNTKLRLKGAQTGHSLLAKKRDALTTRFRAILRRVDEVSTNAYILNACRCVLGGNPYRIVLGKAEDGQGDADRLALAG